MQVSLNDLEAAADEGIITGPQARQLWQYLGTRAQDLPRFSFTHVLYYLGGLIAIGAMTLFMTLGWERFGGWGIVAIALAYGAVGLWLTEYFLRRRHLQIPAGIMATFVVALTPLAIYGLQVALGWWGGEHAYRAYHTRVDWSWLMMELGTLAVAAVMLWRYRMPFSVLPVAVTLWYLSMDLVPFLLGGRLPGDWAGYWELRKFVSLWFGLAMVLLALWVDIRSRHGRDYAFWLYLFGALTFWGGLSLLRSDSELDKFFYLCINLAMIGVGAVLSRRVFAVFGGLGVAGYLGYLAYDVFKESALFPFVLTLIGLGVIYLGIVWQRREAAITSRLRALLPTALRELIEQRM
ncbi:MAG: DUF2157 domain-containing protein [Gammaproteobacteria bacterium]